MNISTIQTAENFIKRSSIPNDEWKFIKTDECITYICKCKKKTRFHPNFMEIGCCLKCEKIEVFAKKLLEFRNFKFVSEVKNDERNKNGQKKRLKITYKCDKDHDCEDYLDNIRRGKDCKECGRERRLKPKRDDIQIIDCDCKEMELGFGKGGSYICEHYNFFVFNEEAMLEWDYIKNNEAGINPMKISPFSHQVCHFICKVYNESYSKVASKCTDGGGCSFCFGVAVCEGNSLATMYPHLLKDWDPDNIIKPTEIRFSSHELVKWICNKGDVPYKYEMCPNQKISPLTSSCCPRCQKGYDQMMGGHEHFIKISNRVHKNKYEYREKYIGILIPLTIYCPVISEITKQIHGNFTQTPVSHKSGIGCPKCTEESTESKGARIITEFLTKWNFIIDVHYIKEKPFLGMKYKKDLFIDFYIKENVVNNKYPIAIEYDGEGHFYDVWNWNSKSAQKRDIRKDLFCINNNISILRIPFNTIITEEFLAILLRNCQGEKLCYFSYKHYQDAVIPRLFPNTDHDIRRIQIPSKYDDLKCTFEDE